MAIKAGRIVTLGNGVVIERLQSAGITSLNIQTEQIKETGNDLNVSVERDTPDLSFDLESYDMTVGAEALLTGVDYSSLVGGEVFKLTDAQPVDIAQPYKPVALSDYSTVAGAIAPYLVLEQMQYKFAVKQNSSQTATLKGDSTYVTDNTPYVETFEGDGVGPYTFTNGTAVATTEQGDTFYAYSVTILFSDGSYKRLFHSAGDYTDTSSGFTLSAANGDLVTGDAGCQVRATYATSTPESFPQSSHTAASVLPAVVKYYSIDVYVSDGAATPTWTRWPGLQSADLSWKVTLDPDDELGNPHHVSMDYDTPDVSGQIVFRPSDPQSMVSWIRRITATQAGQTANALGDTPVPTEIHVKNKSTGARLKTLYIPDAKYTIPAQQAKVGSKLDLTLPYQSDTGALEVYNGVGPSGI